MDLARQDFSIRVLRLLVCVWASRWPSCAARPKKSCCSIAGPMACALLMSTVAVTSNTGRGLVSHQHLFSVRLCFCSFSDDAALLPVQNASQHMLFIRWKLPTATSKASTKCIGNIFSLFVLLVWLGRCILSGMRGHRSFAHPSRARPSSRRHHTNVL